MFMCRPNNIAGAIFVYFPSNLSFQNLRACVCVCERDCDVYARYLCLFVELICMCVGVCACVRVCVCVCVSFVHHSLKII